MAFRTFTVPVFSSRAGPLPVSPPPPSSSLVQAAAISKNTANGTMSLSGFIDCPLSPGPFSPMYVIRGQLGLASALTLPSRVAWSNGPRGTALDQPLEPAGARLRGPHLGLEVGVDQAEVLRVALGPLEVVQQRPDEVADQWYPGRDRLTRGADVVAQERDPRLVVDDPVRSGPLIERGPVLGEEDPRWRVLVIES